jgi:hypothetical protein
VWIFPLLATLVSLAFASVLIRGAIRTGRPAQAMWAIALLLYAASSFAMFLGALTNWTPFEFRAYWLLGAILTVPYLAQGELYLLVPRTVANVLLIAVVFGTAFAVARIRGAPLQTAPLTDQLPLGKDVFGGGSEAHRLPQLYSIPAYVVLVAGAVWSAWRMRRSPVLRDRAMGTLAIAAGATIVAIGSGIGAGYGVVWLFSIGLAAGIAVMFWGFLRATSRPTHARSPA